MLIRWATAAERKTLGYTDPSCGEFDVLAAIDRMSGSILGAVYFSREKKNIQDIFLPTGNPEAAKKLLLCAERQINPRGASFHYRYPKYALNCQEETCPCSDGKLFDDEWLTIAKMEYGFVRAERKAQGKLWGKCHIAANRHYIHLYELPPEELAGFMGDIQKAAKALHEVTGAVKINYEIHGNSAAHLHCHLFPRYLDDDFPGMGIDVTITEPSPYESEDEFAWFVESMREKLAPYNKI